MNSTQSKEMFSQYAEYYDILYQDKNYADEATFISQLIKKLLPNTNADIRVLDIACGTGRHVMELAQLGYKVDGSDISKEMINVAIRECKKKKLNIKFYNESFQTCGKIEGKYDVILSIFSAINYLINYENLSLAFKNISSLLDTNGFFIFDFWNGNAVIQNYSPIRVKRMTGNGKEIIRISKTTIDSIAQTAVINFHFILIENGIILKEFDEKHLVRYFFLQEMVDLLKANNFEIILRCPFMRPDNDITASDWNVTYVVRKALPKP